MKIRIVCSTIILLFLVSSPSFSFRMKLGNNCGLKPEAFEVQI